MEWPLSPSMHWKQNLRKLDFTVQSRQSKLHCVGFFSSHDLIKYFMPCKKPVKVPSLYPTT